MEKKKQRKKNETNIKNKTKKTRTKQTNKQKETNKEKKLEQTGTLLHNRRTHSSEYATKSSSSMTTILIFKV